MTAFRVADSVKEAVASRWPQVDTRWSRHAEFELDDIFRRFNAVPTFAYPARYGLVVAGSSQNRRVVIRVSPDPHADQQMAVSEKLSELGIGPKILGRVKTSAGSWTVMEQVMPGTALSTLPASHDTRPVAGLFRAMREQPAPEAVTQSVSRWLRERLRDAELADLPVGQSVASKDDRTRALAMLDELDRDGFGEGLCHGDCYPGNVLVGQGGELLLIDPRGVRGEVAYDVAVFALKAAEHDEVVAVSMARDLARAGGLNPARSEEWVAVASAARV